jgi:hypothetical protein
MPQPQTTIPQQIAELTRELQTRQRVYPDWIEAKKLSQATADHRKQVLVDVLAMLDAVSCLVEMVTPTQEPPQPQPVQAQLFTPEQVPVTTTPSRGLYAEH